MNLLLRQKLKAFAGKTVILIKNKQDGTVVNITPAFWLILFILEDGDVMNYVLAQNDEISLVMPDWHYGEEDLFEIVLNDTKEVVGNIIFQHKIDNATGNIEYKIFEEYRGNNYAKKALKLFSSNASEISDQDIFISILPNNTASIKTAIGAGAIFHQVVEIPEKYIFSEEGKYKYANMYIIKNDRGVSKWMN